MTEITYTDICNQGFQPLLVDGLLRKLLIEHFSSAENIENNWLKNYIFKEIAPSGILIEEITRWTPEQTELRPAILIRRGAWEYVQTGISDNLISANNNTEHFGNLWAGGHALICLSRTGAATSILATEVARVLQHYGPVIRKLLQFLRFHVKSIGEISYLEESKDLFVVPVALEYFWIESWKLIEKSQILSNIDIQSLL